MTFLKYASTVLLLLLLQIAVLPTFFDGFVPNLLLIFVLLLAASDTSDDKIYILATAAGVSLDLFSSKDFGLFAVTFLSTAIIVRFITTHFTSSGIAGKNLSIILGLTLLVSFVISESFLSFTQTLFILVVNALTLLVLSFIYYVRTR